MLGEREMKLCPTLAPLQGGPSQLVDIAMIPGGVLPEEVGAFDSWGSFAGCESELHHIARCFHKCVVLEALECEHAVWQYARALARGQVRHVAGPSLPSTRTCSIATSASTRSSEGRARDV